ncbi:hypothetical protein ACFXAZ_02410 [Streptomyces sp. NPDC059477]|uniref:hypothetical protein n=1 Tax=Streptomyces sp. NPDC059477 TaxID=3346847 RepID=UPI0036A290B6
MTDLGRRRPVPRKGPDRAYGIPRGPALGIAAALILVGALVPLSPASPARAAHRDAGALPSGEF